MMSSGRIESARAALEVLGESAALEAVAPQWAESMAAWPERGPDFLEPDDIRRNRDWCGFAPDVEDRLVHAAAAIRANPALAALAWHCAWKMFDAPQPGDFAKWPELMQVLGDDRGIFYLLVSMSLVPRMLHHHRALGIPEDVTRATCRQVRCFSMNYARMFQGRPGLPLNQMGWLRHYTREPYLRLGRLEYWLKPYGGGVVVFQHRARRTTLALAEDGARFDRDGFMPRPGDADRLAHGWTATLEETGRTVCGYPITPWGRGLPQPVTLSRSEWERVLAKGTTVLDLHIPGGGRLTPEAGSDSMRRAAEFFPKYFPGQQPAAICCGSWIYNPDLERFLPAEANLVRHLREAYLFPYPSGGYDGLWFVFLQDAFNPQTAPRDTHLRRAILDFLAAGNDWRCGGMFVLTEHVRHLGTQYYRSHWPPDEVGL